MKDAQDVVMSDGENTEVGVPGAPEPETPPVEGEEPPPPPVVEPPVTPPTTEQPEPGGTVGEPWNP